MRRIRSSGFAAVAMLATVNTTHQNLYPATDTDTCTLGNVSYGGPPDFRNRAERRGSPRESSNKRGKWWNR
jgi:hypothetical protein